MTEDERRWIERGETGRPRYWLGPVIGLGTVLVGGLIFVLWICRCASQGP